jgi:hypothetical protein
VARRDRRSHNDERDAGGPTPGSQQYANRETAAGVFGASAPSNRPRRPPPPRRDPPPRRSEPIALPQPVATPVATPVALPAGPKRISFVGRRDLITSGPPRPATRAAPPAAPLAAPPAASPLAPPPASPLAPPAFPLEPPAAGPVEAPRLSVRPLRTPAPAITTIRVEPVPVDGFEYETAALWLSDPAGAAHPPAAAPPVAPPVVAAPVAVARPEPRHAAKHEAPDDLDPEDAGRPVLNWLDE